MTVNEWFINKGSHQQGIDILANLKYPIRRLINLKKPTPSNKEKLRYELGKHKTKVDHSDRILYSSLPQVLRPKYRERNVLFYQKCELKIQLNALPTEAETEALDIQREIVRIDKVLRRIWKELDLWANEKMLVELDPGFDANKLKNSSIILGNIAEIDVKGAKIQLREAYWMLFQKCLKNGDLESARKNLDSFHSSLDPLSS